jgi:lysozyme
MIKELSILLCAAIIFKGRNVIKSAVINSSEAVNNSNVIAFLAMIRKFESGGKYNVIYGGSTFADYSTHPNIHIPFLNPKTGKNDYSSAAGAYQITRPTFIALSAQTGINDFTPPSQDLFAIALLKDCGALTSIINGDFNTALQDASKIWASLPYTQSMQNHVGITAASDAYIKAGGVIV